MKDYIVRILGMVVLISLFVTGACLVFMTPLLIRPLQRLNALLDMICVEKMRSVVFFAHLANFERSL